MKLDELKALEQKACAVPWVVEYGCCVSNHNDLYIYDEGGHGEDDAKLIANLRNLASEILALVEAANHICYEAFSDDEAVCGVEDLISVRDAFNAKLEAL